MARQHGGEGGVREGEGRAGDGARCPQALSGPVGEGLDEPMIVAEFIASCRARRRGESLDACRDHPHVRGEDYDGTFPHVVTPGPPPRAWGGPTTRPHHAPRYRTTPTCVGRTQSRIMFQTLAEDHSHVRGEDDALGRGGEPQPSYSLLMGPAAGTVDSHTARTLTEIGDHPGTETRHRAALTSWDPVAFPRVHLLTYMDLGDCLAAQARADEAVAGWNRALDLAEGMASARSRSALASIRTTLTVYRRRGVPGAALLEHRIRQALV